MNRFSCRKYQIARTLLLAVLLLAGGGPGATAVWAQSTAVISVKALCAEGDYEWEGLVDSATVSTPEFLRLAAEVRQWNDQKLTSKISQINREDKKNMEKSLADMEKLRKMGVFSDAEYQEMRKKLLDDLQKAEAQRKSLLPTSQGGSTASPAALKEQIRQYCIGKRFFSSVRNFRWGRAAVATSVNGEMRWGFIDESGRQVAPCKYWKVYDFKNRNYRSDGVFDPQGDQDTRMWTTVVAPGSYKMGMIDGDGREVIPCRFVTHTSGYDKIVFHITPWGEYAPVQEQEGGKYGIIDRNGNYTLPLTYDRIIRYDYDRECFSSFQSATAGTVYFDHRGNRLSPPEKTNP